MKYTMAVALATAHLTAFSAPDEVTCDRLLKSASDHEYSARRAYLLSTPSKAVAPLEKAAESFEHYAKRCGVERPLSYVGVLVHGRLALVYNTLGKAGASQQSASLAVKYGSMRAKNEVTWPDIEIVIADADMKQKEVLK